MFLDSVLRLAVTTEKDERDIGKRMAKIRVDLIVGISGNDKSAHSFMGEPMSEEAIESLLEALEHAERLATLANKKYIPKKYRKDWFQGVTSMLIGVQWGTKN